MIPVLALVLTATADSQLPQLVVHHHDQMVVQVDVPAQLRDAVLARSTLIDRHEDGFDAFQVRRIEGPAMGVSAGMAMKAWTGRGWAMCRVQQVQVEIAEPHGEQSDALPEVPTWPEPMFLAALDCAADVADHVQMVFPAQVQRTPAFYEEAPASPAQRQRIEALLATDPAHQEMWIEARAEAAGRPIQHEAEVSVARSATGTVWVVRGVLETGAGEYWCGGEDMKRSYAAVLELGPEARVLGQWWGMETEEFDQLVDVDRDGLPEVLGNVWRMESIRLVGLSGEPMAEATTSWWSYCGC